jgi:hypothetical protein
MVSGASFFSACLFAWTVVAGMVPDEPASVSDAVPLVLQGEIGNVEVEKIPELKAYLDENAATAEEKKREIERIRIWDVAVPGASAYSVLGYGCGNKWCNLVLVKKSGSRVETLPFGGLGQYAGYKLSPEKGKVLFLVNNGNVNELLYSFIAVDLEHFALLKEKQHASAHREWPESGWYLAAGSDSIGWLDEHTVYLTVPDLPAQDVAHLHLWQASAKKKYKTVKIGLVSEANQAANGDK